MADDDPMSSVSPAPTRGRPGEPGMLRAAGPITVAVLISRVLAVVREALFAAIFGAGKFADAFVLAFRIPNLLRDLFAEGAMSSAFVPTFTAALTGEGRERAHRLANLLVTGLLMVTGVLALLGVVFAWAIVDFMAPGFRGDPQKRDLAIAGTQIMMPFLPIITVSAAAMGMLNAQRRFFLPAVAPAMFNVASIVVGVYLKWAGYSPEQAVLGWSIGAVGSALVQLAVQLPPLWRLGWRFRPALWQITQDPGIRRIVRLMGPAVVGLAAVQINILVNSIFASNLGDGPMAQLNYAWRLFYLPLGLFGVAIATVTTTNVAEEAARGDHEALRNRVAHALKFAWMLTVPSAVGLIALSVPAIRVIFERGAFVAADTSATALVLIAYMVGLAPYTSVKMLAPAFYALDRPRVPMMASMVAVAVNVTFNTLTYRRFGAVGLAMGTTLAAVANIVLLKLALRRLVGPMKGQHLWSSGAKVLAASVATGAVAFGLWWMLERVVPVGSRTFWTGQGARVLVLLVPMLAGIAVYFVVCRAMGLAELREITGPIARRLRRRAL